MIFPRTRAVSLPIDRHLDDLAQDLAGEYDPEELAGFVRRLDELVESWEFTCALRDMFGALAERPEDQ